MFDFEDGKRGEDDMDLSSIDAANYEVMVAEEAILEWLVNLDGDSAEANDDGEALIEARAASN
jgi:hypothetical protein